LKKNQIHCCFTLGINQLLLTKSGLHNPAKYMNRKLEMFSIHYRKFILQKVEGTCSRKKKTVKCPGTSVVQIDTCFLQSPRFKSSTTKLAAVASINPATNNVIKHLNFKLNKQIK